MFFWFGSCAKPDKTAQTEWFARKLRASFRGMLHAEESLFVCAITQRDFSLRSVHRERNDGEETFFRHGEVSVTKLSNQAYSNDGEIAIQLVQCP